MSGRELRLCVCTLTYFFGARHVCAHAPKPAAAPSIKAKAEDVVLDVIVRDKKEHLVINLKPEDFEVLDN